VAIPEIRYARNGDVALAYQVLGDGPLDLVFLPAFINNIEIAWESPRMRGSSDASRRSRA